VFTAVGTEAGDSRELPCWLRSFDELGVATLGKRMWPSVDDPSWEIDEALKPLAGELVLNKVSAGTFATTGPRTAAPSSARGVGDRDRGVE
jgi:hypothetical protein